MNRIIALVAALMLALSTCCHAGITNNHDKLAHIGASTAVGLVMAQNKPFSRWKPWQRVLFNVVVVGGAKEWYDSRHSDRHTAEWADIGADAVGACSAEGFIWLYHKTW